MKKTSHDIRKMSAEEFARHMHETRLALLARHLNAAVYWRKIADATRRSDVREMARKFMRDSALAWKRHWQAL